MRFAVISLVALTILKLNSPTPILDTARVAHSDQVVSNFDFGVKQPQFPDRSKEIADAHQHDLNKEIAKEAARLQALEAQQKAQAVQTTTVAQNTPTVAPNDAKLYIYMHESGNNPARYNSSGCLGLGQACPASKLLAVCPVITDYACQDAFFTNYALARYGSWEAALAFWQAHRWW